MMRFKWLTLTKISFAIMALSIGAIWLISRDGSIVGVPADGSVSLMLEEEAEPHINQPYIVRVVANSPRDSINSVGIYLRFDPQKLRVVEMDTLKSFCQYYPEKKFDNNLGQVSLACGAPHPGAKGEMELMSLTFLPLTESSSQILVDAKSALLRSDGKGTNLLREYPKLEVSPGVTF